MVCFYCCPTSMNRASGCCVGRELTRGDRYTSAHLHDEDQCREEYDNVRKLEGVKAFGVFGVPTELDCQKDAEAQNSHDH